MASRKVSLVGTEAVDNVANSMSSAAVDLHPTDQRIYEIELELIIPDPAQPRHLLPYDLRTAVQERRLSPAEAMQELLLRAEQDDTVALLILGSADQEEPVEEDDAIDADTGLLALARSIREVGLRHPLNVYRLDDLDRPGRLSYRLGEGERRFWAHHLLVQQGYEAFQRVRCIVEALPEDDEIIHRRQEAENAARLDLPAIARARSIQRIKERLNMEMATRIPGEKTIRLPSQRELQMAIGQHVKNLTGRAISDRMVRNYLTLLNLSAEAQDLAEAAQLTEKQLRPVMRLKTEEAQLELIRRIVEERWSGRRVQAEVTSPPTSKSKLPDASPATIEQRLEKQVLDAAKVVHALLALPDEAYDQAITTLANRARQKKIRQALQILQQTLEEILMKVEGS